MEQTTKDAGGQELTDDPTHVDKLMLLVSKTRLYGVLTVVRIGLRGMGQTSAA